MSQKVICPNCNEEFPLEEGLKNHLKSYEEKIRKEESKKSKEETKKNKEELQKLEKERQQIEENIKLIREWSINNDKYIQND